MGRAADDAGRPATASRCPSVATSDAVRCNGVVRRRGVRARSWARRRSGVRFIGVPSSQIWWLPPPAIASPARARQRRSLLGSPGVSAQVRRRGPAGVVPRLGQPEAEGLRAEHGQRPLRPRRAPGFTGRAASRSSPASAEAIARRSTTSRSAPRIRRSSTSGRSETSGTGCGAAAATSASRSRSDSAIDGTHPGALTRTHVDPLALLLVALLGIDGWQPAAPATAVVGGRLAAEAVDAFPMPERCRSGEARSRSRADSR